MVVGTDHGVFEVVAVVVGTDHVVFEVVAVVVGTDPVGSEAVSAPLVGTDHGRREQFGRSDEASVSTKQVAEELPDMMGHSG